jgi:hypothetical protein
MIILTLLFVLTLQDAASYFNNDWPKAMTEKEFDDLITWFYKKYAPKVKKLGGELVVEKDWDEEIAHASARREKDQWIIRILGGMARHPMITKDALVLTLCHELGHHLGGAPKKKDLFTTSWSSIEGQADYWASVKCFPELFEEEDNVKFLSGQKVSQIVKTRCEKSHLDQRKTALCIRGALAGLSVARFYNRSQEETLPLKFETPDKNLVKKTNFNHPAPQCRLDTHFQGALCSVDWRILNNQSDLYEGFCNLRDGHKEGVRPGCWFKEE